MDCAVETTPAASVEVENQGGKDDKVVKLYSLLFFL